MHGHISPEESERGLRVQGKARSSTPEWGRQEVQFGMVEANI